MVGLEVLDFQRWLQATGRRLNLSDGRFAELYMKHGLVAMGATGKWTRYNRKPAVIALVQEYRRDRVRPRHVGRGDRD